MDVDSASLDAYRPVGDGEDADAGPHTALPRRFIYVKHHAHANKAPEIISLDDESTPASEPGLESPPRSDRPWAPFQSYADYIFASRKVKRRSPNSEIDEDLKDLHEGAYSSNCLVSFHNHRDMDKALAAAHVANVNFETHIVEIYVTGNEFGSRR
ncbi:hypothetical protein B0H14DRAFT_2563532 [Mycena olivaceomarginata]|nr:hypothetical protein B0H14DRAFT_2563532 [Mycena olivaceomarginata]